MEFMFSTRPEIAFRLILYRFRQIVDEMESGPLRFDFTWTSPKLHYIWYQEARELVNLCEEKANDSLESLSVRLMYTATSQDKYHATVEYITREILAKQIKNFEVRIAPVQGENAISLGYPLEFFCLKREKSVGQQKGFATIFWSTESTMVAPFFYFWDNSAVNSIGDVFENYWRRIPKELVCTDGRVEQSNKREEILSKIFEAARRLMCVDSLTKGHLWPLEYHPLYINELNWKSHLIYCNGHACNNHEALYNSIRNMLNEKKNTLSTLKLKLTVFNDPAKDLKQIKPIIEYLLQKINGTVLETAKIILGVSHEEDIRAVSEFLTYMEEIHAPVEVNILLIPSRKSKRGIMLTDIIVIEGLGAGVLLSTDGGTEDLKNFFSIFSQNNSVELSLCDCFDRLWKLYDKKHLRPGMEAKNFLLEVERKLKSN